MHIGLFVHSLSVGGAQFRTLMLANGLARLGHRVDLVTVVSGAAHEDRLDPNVRLWTLSQRPARDVATGIGRTVELAAAVKGLVRYLRSREPEIFVSMANHAMLPAVMAFLLNGQGRRPKLVLRASNHLTRGRKNPLRALKRLPERWFWRQADQVLAVSEDVAGDVRSFIGGPPGRVCVVPSPILPENFRSLCGEHPVVPAPGKDGTPPVIMAMGRFVHQKGFDVLLHAFARLVDRMPAELVLVGDGPERAALMELAVRLGIETAVSFPGLLRNPFPLLSSADLFVLSSRWEGMPAVLVEAMACGCPVVSTDCPGGPKELLGRGALGSLVPVDDPLALAASMEMVLRQPPDREALRRAAGIYEVDSAVTSYQQAFMRVLSMPVRRHTGSDAVTAFDVPDVIPYKPPAPDHGP